MNVLTPFELLRKLMAQAASESGKPSRSVEEDDGNGPHWHREQVCEAPISCYPLRSTTDVVILFVLVRPKTNNIKHKNHKQE